MTTTILALDLGTTTGWALRGSDGHITSGSESFRPQRFEGGGMRFLRFKRWLTEIKQSCDGIGCRMKPVPLASRISHMPLERLSTGVLVGSSAVGDDVS